MNPTIPGNPRKFQREVWFYSATAMRLPKGRGVSYAEASLFDEDRSAKAATASNPDRRNVTELCSTSNNLAFAGVTDQGYDVPAGGCPIVINEPGSTCEVAALIATTLQTTYLTAIAGSGAGGYFGAAGYRGRGTAKALQTKAAVADATSYGVVGSDVTGAATYTTSSKTVTSTGTFANAAEGDKVIVVGGATTASGAAKLTVGEYEIASKTSDNAVVLSTAPGAADSIIFFYVVRGEPTVTAYLCDGEESGLVEFMQPWTDGSGTTAVTSMVGGKTIICGGITLGNGDAIETLAAGAFLGQKKSFVEAGALTTNDYLLDLTALVPTGAGTGIADSLGAVAHAEFDGDGDALNLEYGVAKWIVKSFTTVALT